MKLSLPKLNNFQAVKTTAFGMDMSDTAIKIIQLKQVSKQLEANVLHIENLSPGTIVDGEIKDVKNLVTSLLKITKNKKLPLTQNVVAALPESRTFLQTIIVPRKKEIALEERIIDVLPEYLPFDLDEVYFDSLLLSEDEKSWRVLIGASPKQSVDILLQALDAANLLPLALDLELAASANALIPKDNTPKARAIIDLGATRASLLLHDYGSPQFTMEVDIAGKSVTEEIANQLELSKEDAEKAKISCGLDPSKCEGVLRKILEKHVTESIKQITAANEYYRTHYGYGRPVEEVILTGGGAHLLELDKVLTKVLNVPVNLGNPWQIHNIKVPQINDTMGLSVAVGLALRGLT